VFERFTDDARTVIVDAQMEARGLRHNYIGTEHVLLGLLADPDRPVARLLADEHLLLGLLREGEGVGVQILTRLGARPDRLRTATLQLLPPPGEVVREARRRARPTPRSDLGFLVEPSPDVRRLLMSAGARALDDGRTQIEIADVEEALRGRGGSEGSPEASAG
jgi:Clp amino terminal domain, pathogenicity island component